MGRCTAIQLHGKIGSMSPTWKPSNMHSYHGGTSRMRYRMYAAKPFPSVSVAVPADNVGLTVSIDGVLGMQHAFWKGHDSQALSLDFTCACSCPGLLGEVLGPRRLSGLALPSLLRTELCSVGTCGGCAWTPAVSALDWAFIA